MHASQKNSFLNGSINVQENCWHKNVYHNSKFNLTHSSENKRLTQGMIPGSSSVPDIKYVLPDPVYNYMWIIASNKNLSITSI